MRNSKSSAPGTRWIALVSVALAVVLGYLCYRFQIMPGGKEAPGYLAELTLVVTVVAAFAALISLGGTYIVNRAIDQADQIRRRTEEFDRSLVAQQAKWDKRIDEVETKWLQASNQIERIRATAESHLASLRNSAAAFHPSGLFLADQIRAVSPSIRPDRHGWRASEVGNALVEGIEQAVLVNAEYGAHVQQLFVAAEESEVQGSAMYLTERAVPSEARRLLGDRIELETKRRPDMRSIRLIRFLSELLGNLPSDSSPSRPDC